MVVLQVSRNCSLFYYFFFLMRPKKWQGDPQKIPKAVLHQLCQKSGWEAPKFNKILERKKGFSYSVSILRKASGRGKSRKSGGLITLQLPEQDEAYESAEVLYLFLYLQIQTFKVTLISTLIAS